MIHPRLPDFLRTAIAGFYPHLYTWTPDGGSATIGRPCLFLWQDIEVTNERGIILQHTPTLLVPYDDDIAVGDLVTDVKDDDNLILLSAGTVDSIDPTAEVGRSVTKLCRLSGATTV